MNHIQGPKANAHLPTRGENEQALGQDDVVLRRRILLVEADEVQFRLIDEFRVGSAEDSVLAGEAKVPGELLSHHLHDRRRLPVDLTAAPSEGAGVDLRIQEERHQHDRGERGPEDLHPDVVAGESAPRGAVEAGQL